MGISSTTSEWTAYLFGEYSAKNSQISCAANQICHILCGGYLSCDGIILQCDTGSQCDFSCDEETGCPVTSSDAPTHVPTNKQTPSPTKKPTTQSPSQSPTENPSFSPTSKPTNNPSFDPTNNPSQRPTRDDTPLIVDDSDDYVDDNVGK